MFINMIIYRYTQFIIIILNFNHIRKRQRQLNVQSYNLNTFRDLNTWKASELNS